MPSKFDITTANMYRTVDGACAVIFGINAQVTEQAQNAVLDASERLKQGKQYTITIAETKKRRSIDANAYFHVLVEKIAQTMKNVSTDEVKADLVTNYGQALYVATVPASENIKLIWPYARYISDTDDGQSQYMLYKATHEMDTAEMARLIDGARHEAQQLGIAVETPEELVRLQTLWGK